jgi:hypothetical protein
VASCPSSGPVFRIRPGPRSRPNPASLAGSWPLDPPRCCVDLQRLTTGRSRSCGFPAPPAPFGLSTWTMAFSDQRPSVGFPSDWIPLLAFRSPSRTASSSPERSRRCGVRPPRRRSVRPPLGLAAPPTLPARGIHFPAAATRSDEPSASPPPRRGPPHPLRSAFAVSHGLDGLLPPGPGGVFRPLTPMGSACPAPPSGGGVNRCRLPAEPEFAPSPRRPRSSDPPLRPPRRSLRFRLPVRSPRGPSATRVSGSMLPPSRSLRWRSVPGPAVSGRSVPAAVAPKRLGSIPSDVVPGLPLRRPGHPAPCYRRRRPSPPGRGPVCSTPKFGMDPLVPAALAARVPLGP